MRWGAAVAVLTAAGGAGAITCTHAEIPTLLSQHASAGNCWSMIIVNRVQHVYDMTRLVTNHEGGRAVVENMCGRDGSIGFWCWHDLEELQESIDDGDVTEVCSVPLPTGRHASTLDDDEIKARCANGGTLPAAPATNIQATTVEQHKSTDDCWTSMESGSSNVVMDVSRYVQLHPGGKATVLAMCGADSTKAFKNKHSFVYIEDAVKHGFITMLGQLVGSYTAVPVTGLTPITGTQLATHNTNNDCWGRVDQWVVDMTALRTTHPAGAAMLTCGGDVTASFRSHHADSYVGRMPVVGAYDATSVAPTKCPKFNVQPDGSCKSSTGTLPNTPAVPTNVSLPIVSTADVAAHSSRTDCWVIVRCEVYDYTPFIPFHTGDKQDASGVGAVERMCGGDGTTGFEGIHPLSYLQIAVSMGAVLKGKFAGCQTTSTGPPNIPSPAGTLWYTVRFPNVNAALFDLTATSTTDSIARAVHDALAKNGFGNLGVQVVNLTAGSVTGQVGLRMAHIDHLSSAKRFGQHYLTTVTWQGDTATVQGAGRLDYVAPATPAPPAQPTAPAAPTKVYTIGQVGDHNTANDCWMAMHGQVYSFVGAAAKTHPVGSFLLLGLCGIDATQKFDLNHPMSYLGSARLKKLGGGIIGTLSVASGANVAKPSPVPASTEVLPTKEVTLSGGGKDYLERHNQITDCWMAIAGNVYDATSILDQHDGGKGVVAALCGMDGTVGFACATPPHTNEDIQEAVNDWGMRLVGTLVGGSPEMTCKATLSVPSRTIQGTEITGHSTAQDCWTVISGNVWDLTAYVPKHTGGPTSVINICGGDGTASFTKQHPEGYLVSLEQRGGKILGTLAGPMPSPDTGSVVYAPLKMSDVASHNSVDDCWMVIHGFVLDVTPFLDRHSGGRAILVADCGRDAEQSFTAGGHPVGYVTMMANKRWATIKGCIGGCNSGNTEPTNSTGTGARDPAVNPSGPKATAKARQCTPEEAPVPTTVIPWSEMAKHNTKTDCWMTLGCRVWDLTNYRHGGGQGVIVAWCGDDAQASFLGRHSWPLQNDMLKRGGVVMGVSGDMPIGAGIGRTDPVSLSEIAKHNTPTDCWSCVAGTVYDLSTYVAEHPGGAAVVEPMCGEEATAYLMMVHSRGVMGGLKTQGSCVDNAAKAFRDQNIIDLGAFVGLILLPLLLAGAFMRWGSYRVQDRLFRKPLAKPKAGMAGILLNLVCEMPLGVLIMILWFLSVTIALTFVWLWHYDLYYIEDFAAPGAVGRVTIYMIATAGYLGTRRWTFSWWLWQISYEKALKGHYAIGYIASLYMIVHGALYLDAWGVSNIPSHQKGSAFVLLASIIILFPPVILTHFRVKYYSIFRVSHFAGPVIVVGGVFHLVSLNVDGVMCPGFYTACIWIGSAALFWVCDFIHTLYDAFGRKCTVVEEITVLPVDGDFPYITVTLTKPTEAFPGAWFSVAAGGTASALTHPFTGIIRRCGGVDKEDCEVEFIWKVNPGKTWTAALHSAVLGGNKSMPFYMTGPHGGGLGCLEKMKVIVFVTAGVGVTPAASMAPHLRKAGREVHVVWSSRSLVLLKHCYDKYFAEPVLPSVNYMHLTGAAQSSDVTVPEWVKPGRPKVKEIVQAIVDSSSARKIFDIGVFICGPSALAKDALTIAEEINGSQSNTFVHVHSESFQM